ILALSELGEIIPIAEGSASVAVEYEGMTSIVSVIVEPPRPDKTDTDGDGIPNDQDLDDDNDGMPDSFEELFQLNKNSPLDAGLDKDLDGLSNLLEFAA